MARLSPKLRRKLFLPAVRDESLRGRIFSDAPAVAAELGLTPSEREQYLAFVADRNAADASHHRYADLFDRSLEDFARNEHVFAERESSELAELCYAADWRARIERAGRSARRSGLQRAVFKLIGAPEPDPTAADGHRQRVSAWAKALRQEATRRVALGDAQLPAVLTESVDRLIDVTDR